MKTALFALAAVWAVQAQNCGCTSDETCCQDSQGAECCIDRTTICVAAGGQFTSRCCPKWTVGCNTGSVGCCDPAQTWQRLLVPYKSAPSTSPIPAYPHSAPMPTKSQMTANATKAYAVFVSTLSRLAVYHLAFDGTETSTTVSGPVSNWFAGYYGEATRLFAWDSARTSFYFVDQETLEASSPVILYTIDAETGASTSKTLAVDGYPVGYAYHPESDTFLFSIEKSGSFHFYSHNMASGAFQTLGSVAKGATEDASGYYAGYMTTTSLAGDAVRVGFKTYKDNFAGSGVGITQLQGNGTTWVAKESATGTYYLWSTARLSGSDTFYSLAPSSSLGHAFSVVSWTLYSNPTHLATFSNAYPPGISLGPLGYVASDVMGTTFAGLVSQQIGLERHAWGLAMYNTATKTMTEVQYARLFGTSTLSGFGLA